MTTHCILCGSTKKSVVRDRVRYGVKRKVFTCSACGMVYLEPASETKKYYTSKEYRKKFAPVLGKASNPKQVFDTYLPYQALIIDELRGVLRKDMKVLDVGCSAGQFLTALKGRVKTRVGMELSAVDVAFIEKHLDFKVYDTPIGSTAIPEGPFDLVTALQVLEHVEHPIDFLKDLGTHLKKGGYLYLELPNIDDVLVSRYKVPGYIDFYYREPHLSYFSKKTLARALHAAGFKGRIKTVQRYSMLNHLHWIQTGQPQPNYQAGNTIPQLALGNNAEAKVLQGFLARTDTEYKNLIAKLGLGESLTFLGKKVK